MSLGKLIRQRRESLGLSIAKAAKRLGIAGSHLHGIESGRILRPKIDLLLNMSILYDIPSDEITILAGKIPTDVYWMIVDNPMWLSVIREKKIYPSK